VQYAQGNDEGKEEEYYATPLRVGVMPPCRGFLLS